jgi:DHA1 family multidrug resistance protein-like MFS transporter
MFNNMGIQWAATLLGCVASILVPIPVAFYFYGKNLRKRSKFAPFYDKVAESHAEDPVEENGVAEH